VEGDTVEDRNPVDGLVVTEQLAGTRDGLTQLQRRWIPPKLGGSGSRAALLLVHGIGEHSGRYDHVGRFLASRGYDVLSFDNRGHGQSGGRRGHVERFAEFLDDVEDHVIERRQLGLPVVLMGHSLGGLITATYLVEGRPPPDLLVLSSPALGAQVPRWQRVAAPVLSRLCPRLFVKGSIDGELLSRDRSVQLAYERDPLRVGGSTARMGHEIFVTMKRTSTQLDRVSVPTYVLHGTEDELVPASVSAPLRGRPLVTYQPWPGLRHECLNEPEQAEVLNHLETWLSAQLASLTDRSLDSP
jgi:alpha-beta hydrolase superfamily lysophospholipase